MNTISDDEIIKSAIKLVNEGLRVTFPVKGYSMLPFIIGGKESVDLVKPIDIQVGHVVLAWVEGCRYVVHRIIQIDGDKVVLMGDGNIPHGASKLATYGGDCFLSADGFWLSIEEHG